MNTSLFVSHTPPVSYRPSIAVVGGGASGSFAAIELKRLLPTARVTIIEKNQTLLAKVRISGGGRCNATHACFDPKTLSSYYPRGGKFLLPLFFRFQPKDTIAWFEKEGVFLAEEEDGRMFPTTNSSDTIIQLFFKLFHDLGVSVQKGVRIQAPSIASTERGDIITLISSDDHTPIGTFDAVIMATGSHPEPISWFEKLGMQIIPQVPSLFTFNCPSSPLLDLAGVSVDTARVFFEDLKASRGESKVKEAQGPVLITHWGFSGPAVLKLSAFFARELHERKYTTSFSIDWAPSSSFQDLYDLARTFRRDQGKKSVLSQPLAHLPKSLYERLLLLSNIDPKTAWANLSKRDEETLISHIKRSSYQMNGKTTYKNEFVTAGGISLKEVDPTLLSAKRFPSLFFTGEILDIDGVTGGFNFQAAWTTAYHAARGVVSYLSSKR